MAKDTKADGTDQVIADVDVAYEELGEQARQAEVPDAPASLSADQLRRTWRKVQVVRSDAEKRQDDLKTKRAQLEEDKRDVAKLKKESELERNDVEQRLTAAVEKERALREREINAEHGFRTQNEAALRAQEDRYVELRDQITTLEQEALTARVALDEELTLLRKQRTEALEQELDELRAIRTAELEEQRLTLEREHDELTKIGEESRRQRRELDAERAVLEDDRAAITQEVERRYAAKLEELDAANDGLSKRLEQARADRARVEGELAAAQEATRALDGRPLDVIAADLESLRADRDRFAEELATRPPADQTLELEALRRENDVLAQELLDVRRERNELDIAKHRERGHLAEVEVLSDKARTLESTISAYKSALDEEKQHFDELVEKQATRSPFEQLTRMDADADLNQPPSQLARPQALPEFVDDLRERIAADPLRPGQPLYFSPRDLRVFLGGLAMSRLHLLQGLSGTGKTSLPLAFARAIGGGADVVEVQAGWRDRQDLLGYYNTFERRYDETTFVQALYRAQCDAYADRPYLVVLDEMNLSHPEQYFADLLSALEREELRLTLTNTSLNPAPERLEHGRILRIPDNVWFIGTANHDETTMGFADKTYDRAHVQELPSRRDPFDPSSVSPRAPVSLAALSKLFDHACEHRKSDADIASYYLTSELAGVLADRFGVAWGNRLDKQLRRFVPVVIDSGGSLGEAVDHLLSTKILRKVRERHDVSLDDVEALYDRLLESWGGLVDDGSDPSVSLGILEIEKRRLSGGLG